MIYIVGAGYMAREYCRILQALNREFMIVGRSDEPVQKLVSEFGVDARSGGLTKILGETTQAPEFAIVCTPVETLAALGEELVEFGVKKILLEKPGALTIDELNHLKDLADVKSARVKIAYNRRFYQSTIALEDRLEAEELLAVNFEITEWSHLIENEHWDSTVKQRWVLANTSHVIDLVRHIAGDFSKLSSFSSGSLSWHSSAATFAGAGVTQKGVLLSYCGYWDGPGRWSAEFITKNHRYIFRPMERLQAQVRGSVEIKPLEGIDYSLDDKFKPGLYLLTKSFLSDDWSKLCTLEEQIDAFAEYQKIANY